MTHLPELQCASAYKQLSTAVLDPNRVKASPNDQAVWTLAKANHLLLALQDVHSNASYVNKKTWIEQIEKAKQFELETAAAVHDILPRFAVAELPVLTIKSFLPFPYADSNLDVVTVNTNQHEAYVKLIRKMGYYHFRNLADLREPMKRTYQKTGVCLRLHLHTAVSWNGIVYLPLAQVWLRRRLWKTSGGSVWIPSPEDELLIMAAHVWFENKSISLHEILYWYKLMRQNLDWLYLVNSARKAGWLFGFMSFLAIVSQLAKLLDLTATIPLNLPNIPLRASVRLPYILPMRQNWAVIIKKMGSDVRQGRWRQLPRQIFSYLLVDHFWMYRKAFQKRCKVMAVCS